MQVTEKNNKTLHAKLPIDEGENILAVYKHHWFAYASNWFIGIILIVIVMVVAVFLTTLGDGTGTIAQHKSEVILGAAVFSGFILLGTFIPVYLRSQEQLVLTEEALLQVLQPSLFSSKIDQVNLQHVADVSVRQDFLGTIFGYGHINIETPGEQDNYEFSILPSPHQTARDITKAHENYDSAMQSGRIPTTFGSAPTPASAAPAVPIDPAQYQQFLQYQQMVAQQQASTGQPQQQPAPGLPQAPIDNLPPQPSDMSDDQNPIQQQ